MPFGSFKFINNYYYYLDVCSKINITDFIDANKAVRTSPADVTDDVEEEDEEEEESKEEL